MAPSTGPLTMGLNKKSKKQIYFNFVQENRLTIGALYPSNRRLYVYGFFEQKHKATPEKIHTDAQTR